MKVVFTILLLLAASLSAADISFYYTVEAPPPFLPGADTVQGGIMVFVADPADGATVCVSTDTDVSCLPVIDDGYGYAMALFPTSGSPIGNISVYLAGDSKSINSPVPGVVY